jgi:hypothetical protein
MTIALYDETDESCKLYDIDPSDADIKGEWVDNGIGPYEFHGQRCTDTRMEFELTSVKIRAATEEGGRIVTDKATLRRLEEAALLEDDEDWHQHAQGYDDGGGEE